MDYELKIDNYNNQWEISFKAKGGSVHSFRGQTLKEVLALLPDELFNSYLHEADFESWLAYSKAIEEYR